MSWVFNPFTGCLDFSGSGGGGGNNDGLTKDFVCTENISALKAVRLTNESSIALAQTQTGYADSKVIGIALQSGVAGETISVQRFGVVEDAFFSFTLNQPVFLKPNGLISETQELTGSSVQVGHGLGSGAVYIEIREPIEI